KVHRNGGRITFAPQAWVEEAVPPGRATFGWLARRRFRVGQTHGRLLKEQQGGFGTFVQTGLVLAKVAYCLAGASLTPFHPVRRNRNLLRGIMHAGVVSGLAGMREQRHYGLANPETT